VVDVRIISATHRDLDVQMKEGGSARTSTTAERRFARPAAAVRAARGHRPAARIPQDHRGALRKDVRAFAPEALQLLLSAPWPGNVRQLVNVIEQVVALCASGVVPASLVQQALKEEPAQLASLEQARGAFEREYLIRILRITGGSVTQAAKLAQRNRTEFYKLLERHKLEPKMFKPERGSALT
jgi:two-component system response regulator GlrR